MSCEGWNEKIIDRLAGELPDDEAILLEQHLAECPSCSGEERRLHEIVAAAVGAEPWREGEGLRPALRAELRALRGHDASGAPRSEAGTSRAPFTGLRARILAPLARPVAAYAAIALVVLGAAFGFWMGDRTASSRARANPIAPARSVPGGESRVGETGALLATRNFAVTPADAIPVTSGTLADSL